MQMTTVLVPTDRPVLQLIFSRVHSARTALLSVFFSLLQATFRHLSALFQQSTKMNFHRLHPSSTSKTGTNQRPP